MTTKPVTPQPSTPADALAATDRLFFGQANLDLAKTSRIVGDALRGMHDGELFLEYAAQESFALDDSRIRVASSNETHGFGLRAVLDEAVAYDHSGELDSQALLGAAKAVQGIRSGAKVRRAPQPQPITRAPLYTADNPLAHSDPARIVKLLQDIDSYVRAKNPKIFQVSVGLTGEWRAIQIIRPGGFRAADLRPLVRLNIAAYARDGARTESGSEGTGGRYGYETLFDPKRWQPQADEAVRQALAMLKSDPSPAGEMPVVLGPGWAGILWHEAIGHGLEGDFHRKKTSVFTELMGKQIASKGVTVIDDGTIADRRGSLLIDDEGTPTQRTPLIEDGILTGLMQDRQNARLMGTVSTGSGRRQSFQYAPMPRMRNTIMLGGDRMPEDIIASVKYGLYARKLGGGQVDIVSGQFVFSVAEAYLIVNGKLTDTPVKGATLIGKGSDALFKIGMIGNDQALDPGIGTCGKDGQGVPVGVGQPTLLLSGLTVGGTGVAPKNG